MELGSALAYAGFVDDPAEAWDALFVDVLVDPPIPLVVLDEVMGFLPAEVTLSGYAELDDGSPISLKSGSSLRSGSPAELSERMDRLVLETTTTTRSPGHDTSPAVDPTGLRLAASQKDLRLVVLGYSIPARFLEGSGYDALPLRPLVAGVEVHHGTIDLRWPGFPKTRDELYSASAGWRFCREIADLLDL